MTLIRFLKLIVRFYKVIIIGPLVLAVLVFFLTQKEVKEYSSRMTIYTGIASGYTLQSLENYRVDMFNTNNQFDNLINILKSRETNEEVILKLLAKELILEHPVREIILKPAFDELKSNIPPEIKKIICHDSEDKTYNQLVMFQLANNNNFIYKLINSNHKFYSIKTLSRISIKRIGNSDLIELSYTSEDPAICFQTLQILSNVFIKNYKQIRQIQTDAIVKYFEQQLVTVASDLKIAEDRLLEFNQNNKVINYYEQTRYIAEQKEHLGTEFLHEKMNFSASEAAYKALEEKIGKREKIFWKNDAIIRLRNELYQKNMQLISEEMDLDEKSKPVHFRNKQLINKIDSIKEELQKAVSDIIKINNSKEGIETVQILNQWLNSVIANEESRAKLEVYKQKENEYKKIYAEMAPLGATIKRIEREIDINEKQYLSVLHGLNMAKLKMQDIEMSSNLKVLDPPYYPANAEPSKRKIIVILAFVGGLLLMMTLLFFLEYSDRTIRTPESAEKLTGLNVIGVYPHIQRDMAWVADLAQRLSGILSRQIINNSNQSPTVKIGVFSTSDNEGKTTIIDTVKRDLNSWGYSVFSTYMGVEDLSQKDRLPSQILENKDSFIFVEMPAIIYTPLPGSLLNCFDLLVLICRANREWRPADSHALKSLLDSVKKRPYLILNGVEPDALESYIGEVPKRRGKFRIWAKRILTMKVFTKRSL